MKEIVVSCAAASGVPHDEQKFEPSGFWCPQFVQYMCVTL